METEDTPVTAGMLEKKLLVFGKISDRGQL